MQTTQFLHDQDLQLIAVGLGHLRHGLRNGGQRVGFRVLHHLADGLLDQIAIGEPRRVGLGQLLLDGQVFLR